MIDPPERKVNDSDLACRCHHQVTHLEIVMNQSMFMESVRML